MKKSTINKIMLLLVMLALVFALCACGGNNNTNSGGGGGGGKSGTTEKQQLSTPVVTINDKGEATWAKGGADSFEVKITDADGQVTEKTVEGNKRSVKLNEGETITVRGISSSGAKDPSEWSVPQSVALSATRQLINLVKGLEGITNVIKEAKADDTLSADLSITGFVGKDNDTANDKSMALSVKAKANDSDPEFMIDFKLNGKAYVTLGYKDKMIYVREPINFVNNSDTEKTPESFKMDVTALEPAVKSLMTFAMGKLEGLNPDISEIVKTVDEILNGVGAGIGGLLKVEDGENGTKVIGLTVEILNTALGLLPALPLGIKIDEMADQYIGMANKALETIGVGAIKLNGEELSYKTIQKAVAAADEIVAQQKEDAADLTGEAKEAALAAIRESLLKIIVGYNENKILNSLELKIDLGALHIEGLDYQAGLNIDLPTFAIGDKVTITAPSFEKKDLVIDLNGKLPLKSLDADVKGVIRLSDAFADKNNKWATLTVTEKNHAGVSATAYVDANGAYADFEGIFEILGISKTGYTTKFKQEYVDDENEKFNLVDKINEFAASLNATEASNAPEVTGAEEDEDDGFGGLADYVSEIAAGFGAAENKVDYVCNIIYSFLPIIDPTVTVKGNEGQAELITWLFNYKLGDTNTSAKDYVKFYKNATSFEAILDNLKECHENGKDALDAATSAENKTAGVQLTAPGDDNDMLDYLSYFVVIPTITANEPDFANLAEINDIDALKAWLNWIFPTTNDARKLVEDILGKTLDSVLDDGLYLEAIGGEGYHGAVRAAASKEGQEYVYLAAGFGLGTGNTVAAITADTNFNAQVEGKYVIADTAKAMLEGLRNYGKLS